MHSIVSTRTTAYNLYSTVLSHIKLLKCTVQRSAGSQLITDILASQGDELEHEFDLVIKLKYSVILEILFNVMKDFESFLLLCTLKYTNEELVAN